MASLIPFRWGIPSRMGEDPISSLRRDIEQLFEELSAGPGPVSRERTGGAMLMPRIDVSQSDNAIQIAAELPGVDEKDIEVQLSGDLLTIKGEKRIERQEENKDKNYHLTERSYGSFARSLRLPFEADSSKVEASFDNGVLKVTIPMPPEKQQKTKRIEVKKGASGSQRSAG